MTNMTTANHAFPRSNSAKREMQLMDLSAQMRALGMSIEEQLDFIADTLIEVVHQSNSDGLSVSDETVTAVAQRFWEVIVGPVNRSSCH